MSRREFVRLVRQAYEEVPPKVKAFLTNLDISVEEWPDPEVAVMGDLAGHIEEGDGKGSDSGPTLLGLYLGVPLTERQGEPDFPDRIVIYRQPILQSCKTRAQARKEIRITLLHEVGHYLGMDEEDLHRLGYS